MSEAKKVLSRQDILSVQDIKLEEVPVPEWGGVVFVKGMTGMERDSFEAAVVQQRGKNMQVNMVNIRAKLAALTVCDEDGVRVFTEQDVKELGKKSAAALNRIYEVASRLSGITESDVEELAGEIENDPFGGSPSD